MTHHHHRHEGNTTLTKLVVRESGRPTGVDRPFFLRVPPNSARWYSAPMHPCRYLSLVGLLAGMSGAPAQQPFTLQQVLSAPYATDLTASPLGQRFAWAESAQGRHNLWVGGAGEQAKQLTKYNDDDAQDVSGIAWSPDGASIAFTRGAETGANGKPANPAHLQPEPAVQVMLVRVDGSGSPVAIAQGRAPLFAKDGSAVYFLRAGQIWIRHLATSEGAGECSVERAEDASEAAKRRAACGEQLVFDRGTDSQLTLSPDGKQLAFVSRRDHDHSFIGLFALAERKLSFVAPSTGSDFAPAFSRDGKSLAWLRGPYTEAPEFATNRVSATPWSVQVADVANGVAHTVFAPEVNMPGSVLPHTATGDPKVWWTADRRVVFYSEADGWIHLYAANADGKSAPVLLTPGAFEVEDPAASADGRELVYASNQLPTDDPRFATRMASGKVDTTDTERRHLWRIDFAKASSVPQRVTGGVGIEARPQFSADGKMLAALVSDAQNPMHPAMIAADGHVAAMRADRPPRDYPAAVLRAPEQVFFLSADKAYKLHGQLFLPRGEADPPASRREDKQKIGATAQGKHPAILFFHGGPNREMLLGYPSMEYYSNAYAMNEYLASRGFIVLSVNYRCGIGYGMEFRQCEHAGADGGSEYNDALGAAAYLRSRPDVDQQHIGIWGGSYGGYFAALALARNSDIFAAGVDFHGVHEWAREDNTADWMRGSFAERDAIAARAHSSSPMADVDKWRSPVLLIHGDNDANVAYKQTPMLADALRVKGVHVEELIFPDEVHEFLLHMDWLRSYEAEAEFFERTLMH